MTVSRTRPGDRRSSVVAALLGALTTWLVLTTSSNSGAGMQQRHSQVSSACTSKALQPPSMRLEMGELLEKEGFTSGAELGVQRGEFAKVVLTDWHSCQTYILVDLWKQQENYKEAANVDNDKQEEYYETAKANLEPFSSKTQFLRMYTSEAAKQVPDASLDFVYIDARHDYCGAAQDIELWWPKVKPGGILAGHDYLDAQEIKNYHPTEDWGLCMNGTRNEGAVKGAVTDFAQRLGLTVAVTYREPDNPYNTWMVRKSCR